MLARRPGCAGLDQLIPLITAPTSTLGLHPMRAAPAKPCPKAQGSCGRGTATQCRSSVAGQSLQQRAATQPEPSSRSANGGRVSRLEQLLGGGARVTAAAQEAWAQVLRPGDIAVDATAGNGHDTLFMAQAVGPSGTVHALDIQAQAIESTRARIESHLEAGARPAMFYHQACHSRMQELVGYSCVARVVSFNLGYLPAGDKRITTTATTTPQAIEAALEVVMPGGLISILCYIGHAGGAAEYEAVRSLVGQLSPIYWVTTESRLLNRPTAPVLILVWRAAGPAPPGGPTHRGSR